MTTRISSTCTNTCCIYDGSGDKPYTGDVAISGDRIAALGDIGDSSAGLEINVKGLAVAPGFVNMMSWANESLIEDGRSQSDIRQGITLEIMGEGESMGPLNERVKSEMLQSQSDIRYDIEWTTLAGYLEFLEQRGVSPNVASFIGSASPRNFIIGQEDREPTPEEIKQMQDLVRQAMEEGALGVASSLIYPPGSFAKTDELIALSKVAADVYTYPAGSTGLNAAIPPWVQEGGFSASVERMKDPEMRDKIAEEMLEHSSAWENMYPGAGTPDNILLVGFKSDALKPLTGKVYRTN